MKRYNIINNTLGWLAFIIAAFTYLLTVEPTASFWDCPEFIAQGFKLEVGHPPGNPIFMLTARFFVTLFGGSAQSAALAVNCMSALLSAGTILLLFWTITHLVRRLIVRDDATSVSAVKTVVIMAAGMCGALAYTWSDTFWFSAVEGEVYAFSSFCTALVFWLILKWENHADEPHSDRYLVLIAYVIGISIAVHLLNLLCIPAIVLVFYYKKWANPNVKGSLIALCVSALIVFFILYGLVPGFIAVAQRFELLFVNVFGAPYNSGVMAYTVITLAAFVWTIWQLYRQRSAVAIRIGVFVSVILSGMPFVGHSWLIPLILIIALFCYLFFFCRVIPVRIFNVAMLSVMVIFIGYSSYALLLIRSSADTPMNQNAPDNVFALASYLNREQYGDRPLFYGPTVAEEISYVDLGQDEEGNIIRGAEVDLNGYPAVRPVRGVVYDAGVPVDNSTPQYTKVVKTSPDEPDRYVAEALRPDYEYSSDLKMLFPRMYSPDDRNVRNYKSWAEYENPYLARIPANVRHQWAQQGYVTQAELAPYLDGMTEIDMGTRSADGTPYSTYAWKMGVMPNLQFFLNYQLTHMYWRYFMWNFAGRQNDIQGNGEPHLGNWISGIPALDNGRLGDQSQLPPEFGDANKGHNVFYMLPLLLGVIGLLWQALSLRHVNPRRGIEQFWVIFFLFFMTGIAIVLYLNQTAPQPRERDYAFAGSFYAFAIWIGIGIPAVYSLLGSLLRLCTGRNAVKAKGSRQARAEQPLPASLKWVCAAVAVVFALGVPLQMVSQTWDDHDRSGRYTTRDFGMNYLNSLDDNAIIFTNGDNDTFPLWYAQEVEGCRTDVKVVNLSYLATDWYANQISRPSYEAAGVPMYARPVDYAYDRFWGQRMIDTSDSLAMLPRTAAEALPQFYAGTAPSLQRLRAKYGLSPEESHLLFTDGNVYAPLDSAAVMRVFGQYPQYADSLHHGAYMDLKASQYPASASLSRALTFDIVANSASGSFARPVFFATTVPDDMAIGFRSNLQTVGMAKQLTPFENPVLPRLAQKGYINVITRFRWGNLDSGRVIYLDETVRRMVSSTRLAILDIAGSLLAEPAEPASADAIAASRKAGLPAPATQLDMARNLLDYMQRRLPAKAAPYESMIDLSLAEVYLRIWALSGRDSDLRQGRDFALACIDRYGALLRYARSLTPSQRSRLGSSESNGMQFAAIAVGFLNYIDLRQAMVKAGAPGYEIQALDNNMSLDSAFHAYRWVYVAGSTPEDLEEIASYDRYYAPEADYGLFLMQLHDTYGVPRYKATDSAAKKMGIARKDWISLTR